MRYVKIKEVAEVIMGQSPDSNSYNDKGIGIPFFQGKSEFGKINPIIKMYCTEPKKTAQPLDILMSVRAPVGDVNISNIDCCIGRGLCSIRSKENINYKYLYYYLLTQKKNLENQSTGSTFKAINKNIILDIEIPITDIETQNKIVEVLDKAQDLIDKKIEQIDLLDELVKSRFIEMFGNPISNPKGWKKMTLNDISMKKGEYGSGESAVEYKENYPRYIRITDIDDNGKLNNSKMTVNNLDEYEKYKLNDGDILLARTGATVGKTFLYKEVYGKCLFAGYLIRFIPNKDIINPEFLFAFTKTDFYKSWIKSKQNVVAQPNINAKQYGSLEIPIPPIELQNEFAVFVEKIDSIKAAAEKSLEQLNYNFNSLMQKAFKGELF